MPIVFPCSCGQPMRTGDEHAGKHVRCPKCSALVVVPAQSATIQKASPPNAYNQSFPMNRSRDNPSPARMKPATPPAKDRSYEAGGDEEVPLAARIEEDEDIPCAKRLEDEGEKFEVLETVGDLPTVQRSKKRRKNRDLPPDVPRFRSIEEELYNPPATFLGMDGAGWMRLIFMAIGFFLCCFCCVVTVASNNIYMLIPMILTDLLIVGMVCVALRVGR